MLRRGLFEKVTVLNGEGSVLFGGEIKVILRKTRQMLVLTTDATVLIFLKESIIALRGRQALRFLGAAAGAGGGTFGGQGFDMKPSGQDATLPLYMKPTKVIAGRNYDAITEIGN